MTSVLRLKTMLRGRGQQNSVARASHQRIDVRVGRAAQTSQPAGASLRRPSPENRQGRFETDPVALIMARTTSSSVWPIKRDRSCEAFLAAGAMVLLTSCSGSPAKPLLPSGQPLRVISSDSALPTLRDDLISTAAARFGLLRLREAESARAVLMAKRFAGRGPLPPPSAGADWLPTPQFAFLVRRQSGWFIANPSGWRMLDSAMSVRLDQMVTEASLAGSQTDATACPDYGADVVLVRNSRREQVRKAECPGAVSTLVGTVLRL